MFHTKPLKLYLDPREIAELLYYEVEGLLRRPKLAGFFLPWGAWPVVQKQEEYFVKAFRNRFDSSPIMQKVQDIAVIPKLRRDIFDSNGNMVLRSRDARLIVTESVTPLVEVDLLEALVENAITDMSSWIAPGNKPDPYDVVKEFVITEEEYNFLAPSPCRYEDWADAGIVRVLRMTELFLSNVYRYIGDDTTIIHTLVRNHGDFVIEKTVDYRIVEYDRLKSIGAI